MNKYQNLSLNLTKSMSYRNIFGLVLFILFLCHFGFRLYSYKSEYLLKYNPSYWETRYNQSQWVDPVSTNPIGDDGLYAFAGWEYVNGRDPTTLNAEMPPLGKYFIGLSILLFGNQNIFAIFFAICVLVLFYVLNLIVLKDKILAFIPVFLFSLEPLFYTQLRAPFLDLTHLTFLLAAFILFFKNRFALSMIAIGLMMGVKASSATFGLVLATQGGFLFLQKKYADIKRLILFAPIALLTFASIYLRFFLNGNNVWDFMGVQKWILTFYAIGAKGNAMTIWPLLISGTWNTWWNESIHVAEWSFMWPILLVCFIAFCIMQCKERRVHTISLFALWVSIYLVFLMIVPVWPRYLLLILPFMYTIAIWVIFKSMPNFLARFLR